MKDRKNKEAFMEKTFVKCEKCGYNNLKSRFNYYGTCLRCKNVMDEKIYFRHRLWKLSKKDKNKDNSVLSF